jgi:general nucleoside transport system permease protein
VSQQTSKPNKKSLIKTLLANSVFSYLVAILVAFLVVGIFIALMGFDVWQAYVTILTTSFKTTNGFTQTLLKWVPLTLLALSFTIPMATGKFNIGGEGQLLLGAIGATAAGIFFADLPGYLLLPMVMIAGMITGGIWGLIPGVLLYRFKINEILSTVVLNFVAFALVDYICTSVWRDPIAGHPTTIPLGEGGWLPRIIQNPPLHSGIFIVIVVAILAYIFTNRSTLGFDLVATGSNPRTARVYGINVRVMFVLGLTLAGVLAGLAGAIEVSGVQHRLILGMHSNFKILGIIIGLIAKGSNAAVPFVAFFIAVLEVGASAMQRTMSIPIEIVFIAEAMILLLVLLSDVVRRK